MTVDAPRNPFAIAGFRYFWCARMVMFLASMAMVVVIGWQVYDIARHDHGMSIRAASFQLGLIGLAQFAPLLLLTLYSGWVADRFDRRRVSQAAVAIELICAVVLAWTTHAGIITLPLLFGVAMFLGVARAFAAPAMQGLTPGLVPAPLLPSAIAYSSMAWQAGAIAGPAMGGYLYAIGPALPYAVAAGLLLLSILSLAMVGPVPRTALARTQSAWRQMIEGLHYVRRNRLVLGTVTLDFFAVLMAGATAMLPVYARDIFHVGPEGLGHLRAAPAAGAALVALWLGWRPLRHNVGNKMLWAVAAYGVATILFGLSHLIVPGNPMPFALLMLALLGACDMISVYVRQSLVQIYTPDDMRGRVSAVSVLFISGSNELGEAESGLLGAVIGPVAAVVGGGIGAILVTLLWGRLFPAIRAARTFDPPALAATPASSDDGGSDSPSASARRPDERDAATPDAASAKENCA